MRFSIECDNNVETFSSFKEASEKIGLSRNEIWKFLKKNPDGKTFIRKCDKKKFFIKEEKDERVVTIEGEDFYTYHEIQRKFQIDAADFVRELVKNKKQFQGRKIDWISEDLEKKIDFVNRDKMLRKINQKASGWNSQFVEKEKYVNLI